jgi:chromosome segregation ATPase
MAETADEAFARGQTQGEVNARLNTHEARLNTHDITIASIGPQIAVLTTSITDLRADLRGRETTAQALLDADERRRRELDEADEQRRKRADEAREALATEDETRAKVAARKFMPITRALAVLAAIEGVVLTYLTWQQATGKG